MFQFISDSVTTITNAVNKTTYEDEITTQSSSFPPPNLTAQLVSFTKSSDDDFHLYKITVQFGYRKWTVFKRYKQFFELHTHHIAPLQTQPIDVKSALHSQHTTMILLPPKKICGNRAEQFVVNRTEQLTQYLKQCMANALLRQSRVLREFLTDGGDTERLARLYNEYVPLLHAGARFKKIGAVFTRDIRMRLTDDCCALEYWTPIDGLFGKGDDVRLLRIHTITNVSPTNDGLIITAERECELDTSANSKSKFVRTAWLNGLTELISLMHLVRGDANDLREKEKARKASTFRDMTNNRQKQKRADKRQGLADKYGTRN